MGANIYRNKKPALAFLLPAFLFMVLPQENKKPLAASRMTSRLTYCFFIWTFFVKFNISVSVRYRQI